MRDDERGDTACAQIEQDQDENAGKKREESEEQISPVGNERQCAMLRGPKETNDQVGDPGVAGERLQSRQRITLIRDFFSGRLGWPGYCPDKGVSAGTLESVDPFKSPLRR